MSFNPIASNRIAPKRISIFSTDPKCPTKEPSSVVSFILFAGNLLFVLQFFVVVVGLLLLGWQQNIVVVGIEFRSPALYVTFSNCHCCCGCFCCCSGRWMEYLVEGRTLFSLFSPNSAKYSTVRAFIFQSESVRSFSLVNDTECLSCAWVQ